MVRSARAKRERLGGRPARRRAFTLLEVILALAILGLALATLGQAVGRSHDSARRAADQTDLSLVAQGVLDELLAGVRPMAAFDGEAVPDPGDPSAPAVAVVSATVESSPEFDGLLVLRVRAVPATKAPSALDTVEIVRWVVDPSREAAAAETEQAL